MCACEHGPQLSAYHDGELPEPHRIILAGHLLQCPECRAELHEIQAMSEALHSTVLPTLPAEARERLSAGAKRVPQRGIVRAVRVLMAIAAVIFLVAAGSLVIQIRQAARGTAPMNGTPVGVNGTDDGHSPMHFARWIFEELRGNR